MKILVIICSNEFNKCNFDNISTLLQYLNSLSDTTVEYCGISSNDVFYNYEDIISYKYKIINPKQQFSKICDFITEHKKELNYDWYIKFRPEIRLLEQINFDILCDKSINARARVYRGPKKIKYGMSVNGEGVWNNIGDCFYDDVEKTVMLDDQLYIFHNNVIQLGAFETNMANEREIEITQSRIWKERNIKLNVVGIYLEFTKFNVFSGDLNYAIYPTNLNYYNI